MSWHSCGFILKRDYSSNPNDLLESLGHSHLEPYGEMDFEDAMAPGDINGCYLGFADGWTILFDYLGYQNANGMIRTEGAVTLTANSPLCRLSAESRIFSFFLEGYADIAAFSWHENGELLRSLYIEGSSLILDFGRSSAQEIAAFEGAPDNEQAILSLMESLTLPLERIATIPYEYYWPK